MVKKKTKKSKGLKGKRAKLYLSDNAREILAKRYLRKDERGKVIEEPEDMFERVSSFIAAADVKYGATGEEVEKTETEFYNMMVKLDFFPNSPTLRGAGREIHQLSGCFVLPIEDSMEGIFKALTNMALVHKGGGGTGFSFGRLRPEGDKVGTTGGVAGGPLSFMNIFNTTAGEVMQGGTRVGANMGILPVTHPDILKFIDVKLDGKSFRNFNLSVSVTDDFMRKVERDEEYDLFNPRDNKKVGKLRAKEIFDRIVANAWKNGDPGIIFIDRINRDNPTPRLGNIESTNPCGEQPLLPYESCNLGSINMANMVKGKGVNWGYFKETVKNAVHFLDNVIDVNKYTIPEIEEITKGNRKIGLGLMGWADMLIRLQIPYNSKEALNLAERAMKFLTNTAHEASQEIAQRRGVFPNWKNSIFAKKPASQRGEKLKMRNAAVTTIAPTGTLSLIGNCSGGIEPLFAVAYKKKSIWTKEGKAQLEQFFINPLFEYYAKREGFWSKELVEKIAQKNSIADIEEIPSQWRKIFITAHDITPLEHVRMQAAFQKYTDNAVSKTINFPRNATAEDIKRAYLLAFKLGCKGITVYREGSKENQVFTTEATYKKEEKAEESKVKRLTPRRRPRVTTGITEKVKTGCGNLYITINFDEYGPFEVFSAMGKAGGCASSQLEALSRTISYSLRAGIPVEDIIDQLKSIRCPSPIWQEGELILSCADAIAKVLEKHCLKKDQPQLFKNGEEEKSFEKKVAILQPGEAAEMKTMAACPDCGGVLEHKEGCLLCSACGFSKCG